MTNNVLFLISKNDFFSASFHIEEKIQKVLLQIILPSGLIILLSIIVIIVVIRKLLKNMESEIEKINQYCKHILKDKLDINIPEYEGSEEIG